MPPSSEVSSSPDGAAVLGVDCYSGDLDAATQEVVERARSGQGGYACLCNTHVLMTALRDADLLDALERSWVTFPDGAPLAWLMRRTGHSSAKRIGGPDLMPRVIDDARAEGLRHGFYGSTRPTLNRLVGRVHHSYPGAQVAIAIAPPFHDLSDDEVGQHISEIRAAEVDILWLGLGAPRQELWMARHAWRLAPTVVLGVGAAFDFFAATKTRAPEWMQRSGLEWVHRMGSEPGRLGRRYAVTNSRFIAAASYEMLFTRLRR
jgi:N-acetylglucosaminyldiphosphoundecaprenol N-acetyl-beta-D-mannosaminyltransferase